MRLSQTGRAFGTFAGRYNSKVFSTNFSTGTGGELSKFVWVGGVLLAAFAGAAFAQAGDAAKAHEKTAMCLGCHAIPGWRTAYPEVYSVPMIAGQHPQYIVRALQAYKSGERSHPSMRAIAASLSDEDMANLAAYYGSAPPAVAKK